MSLLLLLFNEKVQVQPAILLMFICVETLHVHVLADADALVEEDHFFFAGEPLQRVRDLHVDLELDDLAQFANHDVVAHVEPEEELPQNPLVLNHLVVYRLDHHRQHRRVLEAEVFELNFSLRC